MLDMPDHELARYFSRDDYLCTRWLNAPSIPWIERLESRIRLMSTETLSSDNAMDAPADCSTSVIE